MENNEQDKNVTTATGGDTQATVGVTPFNLTTSSTNYEPPTDYKSKETPALVTIIQDAVTERNKYVDSLISSEIEVRRIDKEILYPALVVIRQRYNDCKTPEEKKLVVPGCKNWTAYIKSLNVADSILRVWNHREANKSKIGVYLHRLTDETEATTIEGDTKPTPIAEAKSADAEPTQIGDAKPTPKSTSVATVSASTQAPQPTVEPVEEPVSISVPESTTAVTESPVDGFRKQLNAATSQLKAVLQQLKKARQLADLILAFNGTPPDAEAISKVVELAREIQRTKGLVSDVEFTVAEAETAHV